MKSGSKRSYRARINIIGHSGAGKTSLTRRLLGKSFVEEHNSTDGIETHLIKLDLESAEIREDWEEATVDHEEILRAFNTEVLAKHDASAKQAPADLEAQQHTPEERKQVIDAPSIERRSWQRFQGDQPQPSL